MYCRNCASQLPENASVCPNCGTSPGMGINNCFNCASPTPPGAAVCPNCGVSLIQSQQAAPAAANQKSKVAAILLAFFLGSLGIHNFYLGYKKKAITQLLICILGAIIFVGPAISGIWAFVEFIMLITGSISTDADGVPLAN